jgi:hypothetical protein
MKTLNNKKTGVTTSDIDSSGGLDIDGVGNVTIDSATGSITMGAVLTDGQTLKLGKNAATEMIFSPHGTAGSEKISLTNTSGDAVDAISLTSTAGGITLDAAAVHFQDGTNAAPSITNAGDTNTGIYFHAADAVYVTVGGTSRLKVTTSGASVVGALTATLDITGFASDKRLKKNVKILSEPLDKLKILSGFTYDWDQDKCKKAGFEPIQEEQIGVFAQDVQSVIPQAVKPAPFDTDNEGLSISGDNYLTVQYEKIVPLLIESIKEQQKQIEELRNEVNLLKK